MPPRRVFALVGPTASGKTALGIALARRLDAEIVGADSRQVYRRLDIGSAKPSPAERAAAPHHLIDVVDPDQGFDCARFRELALAAIDDIERRGKRVILVGGTGLYVKVVQRGLFAGPPRDPQLRASLEREEREAPGTLHRRLHEVDPASAARLHANDRVRLIRALEVLEVSGRPISVWQAEHAFGDRAVEMKVVAVNLPRAVLYERIQRRCEEMIAAGLVAEVEKLYRSGLDPHLASLQSPGYREVGEHVRGECDLDTAVARMTRATRRLAKRQLTWFRGDATAIWCEPKLDAIEPLAAEFFA